MIIQSVILKDMPMPPSINACYATIWKTKRRVKTAALNTYERMMQMWAHDHQSALNMARDLTTKLQPGQALEVDRIFYFSRGDILTKDTKKDKPRPKRNDTTNRIKAADDAVSALIGIDDCYFWDGTHRKKVLNTDHPGFADYTLTIIDIDGY